MFHLKIDNFQSIKHIELEVQGLTVLLGRSHQGKSAIVRSMDTLLTSTWFQDAYMRKGEGQTQVSLAHSSGDSITFNRTGVKTTYSVNGTHVAKLGGSAPPEFKDLGWGEVKVGETKDDVYQITPQVQHQFDIPYNDQLRPAIMTQLIGSFADLSRYQVAHTKSRSEQSELRRESERTQVSLGNISAIAEHFVSRNPSQGLEILKDLSNTEQMLGSCVESFSAWISSLTLLKKVATAVQNLSQEASTLRSLEPISQVTEVSSFISKSLILRTYQPWVDGVEKYSAHLKKISPLLKVVSPKSTQAIIESKKHLELFTIHIQGVIATPYKSFDTSNISRVFKSLVRNMQDYSDLKSTVSMEAQALDSIKQQKSSLLDLFASGHCPLCLSKMHG